MIGRNVEQLDYLRFSTTLYSEVAAMYGIPPSSPEIVSAIYSTALLDAVGTDLEGQQIVKCESVARYVYCLGLCAATISCGIIL